MGIGTDANDKEVDIIYGQIVGLELGEGAGADESVMRISYDKTIRVGAADVVIIGKEEYDDLKMGRPSWLCNQKGDDEESPA